MIKIKFLCWSFSLPKHWEINQNNSTLLFIWHKPGKYHIYMVFYPCNCSIIWDSKRKYDILTEFNIEKIKIKYNLVFLCIGTFINWSNVFPCFYYIKCCCLCKVFLFYITKRIYVWISLMTLANINIIWMCLTILVHDTIG